MSDHSINLPSSKTRAFNKIPWTYLLIVYLVVAHLMNADLDGMPGYVFIAVGVLVLFLEFFKSGDISTATFLTDTLSAVTGLILATVLLSYLYFKLGQSPNFFHWFGYTILVGDAIMSPFNSFRTALRNFGVGP
jgi:FtsH-binding integral membrane protein